MDIEYKIDFKNDYKNMIIEEFEENKIDIKNIDKDDLVKLSQKFHAYQKSLITDKNSVEENTSMDSKYSSDMMLKWIVYIEDGIKKSINDVVEAARNNNIKVDKFPLDIQLNLDIESKTYTVYEKTNDFNIDLES